MPDNNVVNPEVKLLHSILEEELKDEDDKKLKEVIKQKADVLYSLLSVTNAQDLDEEELRKRIKSVIEG
jgi:DNA-binding transcriptional regulator GbsR (MarR family)